MSDGESILRAFRNKGHEPNTVGKYPKNNMFIYERCLHCGVSIYNWSMSGQAICEPRINISPKAKEPTEADS